MTYAVIMAGGSGTRFWPKSTQSRPKQFLNLFGERTMIQSTVDRLEGFVQQEQCVIVTNDNYVDFIKMQLPGIPGKYIIGEPVARNTAPCVAAAARILYNEDPDAVMVVLPADHLIRDEEAFRVILQAAVETAQSEESLVTVGIKPNRPETGYGYIRYDKSSRFKNSNQEVYSVQNFTEKPDREKAEAFLESGDYLWNSGMFIWTAKTILKAFEKYQPEIYRHLATLKGENVSQDEINRFYHACPSISVDYGIMEHAEKVHVLPGEFGWSDAGSWMAVHELSEKDEAGNSVIASASSVQRAKGNLVRSESGKIIALVGVEDLAVVETEDAILVLNLNKSQDVKKVVEHLKEEESLKKYL